MIDNFDIMNEVEEIDIAFLQRVLNEVQVSCALPMQIPIQSVVGYVRQAAEWFWEMDNDMCVSCGQCMVSCPFGAIADKSQIFQLIRAMQSGKKIIAQVAPAFVGQFGKNITPDAFKTALKQLGFYDVYETAIGADLGAFRKSRIYQFLRCL